MVKSCCNRGLGRRSPNQANPLLYPDFPPPPYCVSGRPVRADPLPPPADRYGLPASHDAACTAHTWIPAKFGEARAGSSQYRSKFGRFQDEVGRCFPNFCWSRPKAVRARLKNGPNSVDTGQRLQTPAVVPRARPCFGFGVGPMLEKAELHSPLPMRRSGAIPDPDIAHPIAGNRDKGWPNSLYSRSKSRRSGRFRPNIGLNWTNFNQLLPNLARPGPNLAK